MNSFVFLLLLLVLIAKKLWIIEKIKLFSLFFSEAILVKCINTFDRKWVKFQFISGHYGNHGVDCVTDELFTIKVSFDRLF